MSRPSLLSPWVVFPALAAALLLTALFQPTQTADERLTTYSAAPNGGRALHDAAAKLGWRPARRRARFAGALDSTVTYAVLAPEYAIDGAETHALLDAVRRGAGLLLAVSEDESATAVLADSLRLTTAGVGFHALAGGAAERPVLMGEGTDDEDERGGECRTAPGIGTNYVRQVFAAKGQPPRDTTTLLAATYGDRNLAVAYRRPLGRGRVVVVSDPDLLRNDVLRLCGGAQAPQRPGVRAVRFLEAAAPGGGALVFDEYHHGFGRLEESGPVTYALTRTGWGRALGVAALAALLALWAAGARALVPVDRGRIERRSPLEHVGALARAYEQVGAARTAARRLVRGLRRRHPGAARRGADDDAFLASLADREPALASAVALVRDATARQLGPAELVQVGEAVDAIDRALARPGTPAARPSSMPNERPRTP